MDTHTEGKNGQRKHPPCRQVNLPKKATVQIADKPPAKTAERYRVVPIQRVEPNPWNPNFMDKKFFEKLKTNLERTLREAGDVPPIVVRPHPEHASHYQIIDGFHRWKALRELRQKRIGVFVIHVSDADARILTANLNYLRGNPDVSKYAANIVDLLGLGLQVADLEALLPQTGDALANLIEESKLSFDAFAALRDTEKDSGDEDEDEADEGDEEEDGSVTEETAWVDLTFRVSVAQARVIEKEIKRIAAVLRGKAVRARALEYMAAQSATCELPEGDE